MVGIAEIKPGTDIRINMSGGMLAVTKVVVAGDNALTVHEFSSYNGLAQIIVDEKYDLGTYRYEFVHPDGRTVQYPVTIQGPDGAIHATRFVALPA